MTRQKKNAHKNQGIFTSAQDDVNYDVFSDIEYLCQSTNVISDSLKNGLDIAQLPNGDVVVTQIKMVHTQYSWDRNKRRMVRVGQSD